MTVTKLHFSEPLRKSFIQEIKEEILLLQKRYPEDVPEHFRFKQFYFSIIRFLLPLQIRVVWYYLEDRKGINHALSNCSASATEPSGTSRVFLEPLVPGRKAAGSAQSFTHACCNREHSGMLLHHPDLYSHMQGPQNLAFPSKIR